MNRSHFTPYVDVSVNANWSDPAYPAGKPNPDYVDNVIIWGAGGLTLAFITNATEDTYSPCWASQPTMLLDWAKPMAHQLKEANKRVVVSFGGAAGWDVSYPDATTVDDLVSTYSLVINGYHADGLDFDLENGLYDVSKIVSALQVIQNNFPSVQLSITLPTLATGLTGAGLGIVQAMAEGGLSFVINGMAMDYYNPEMDEDMGASAMAAALKIAEQLAEYFPNYTEEQRLGMTALTPMIGLNDDTAASFTLTHARDVGAFARMKGLFSLSFWDLNRDNPSSFSYTDNQSSSYNPTTGEANQTESGQYTMAFSTGIGE
ncbi:Probable bifunctional chitinase/lysozyme precursor [Serratia quinivorans]|uniref:glycosyl hydrolase family 18 protein n=1 Tax=Serratia quinivorans TaxID=137545 RepID=UPI00217C46DE|nr:glycosyl hydrolase family 18 protein [Serratia quinivorans]CAI1963674.1 Probable bifunctional chitinase/lysozyme precursor [Serratia quinivorans]